MEKTVREVAKELRNLGSSKIVTNNGTKVFLLENYTTKDFASQAIGTFKFDNDGNIIALRQIFCSIEPSRYTKGLDDLKKNKNWWLFDPKDEFNFFRENQFVLPEKELNSFLMQNGDIDHYATVTEVDFMLSTIEQFIN